KTELVVDNIYVHIKSEQEAREVDFILRNAGEEFDDHFPWGTTQPYLLFLKEAGDWFYNQGSNSRVEITIPQLAEMLGVEYPIKQKLFVIGNWYKRVDDNVIFQFNGKFDYEGEPCGPGFIGEAWASEFSSTGWSGEFEPANEDEVRQLLRKRAPVRPITDLNKELPTLQELIDSARKEIVKIDRRYPHWFEDD